MKRFRARRKQWCVFQVESIVEIVFTFVRHYGTVCEFASSEPCVATVS